MNDPAATTSRAGIESLVARLLEALLRHDAAACAALFTDDGLVLSPYGPPARGRAQIRATHQSWFDEGETNKRLTLQEADASGELGYCILGYAGDYLQPDGSNTTDRGRSVNVLRRQVDGDWKIQVSSLIPDRP
jgi:uncharacterized protein (TIGR02246 family)